MSANKNIPASIRQRLLNKAHETNRPFNEILQYYAIERFLYRISQSDYADKFILKGALMFRAWGASEYRPTRDIDLLGFTTNELNGVDKIFRELCEQGKENDGLLFDQETVESERIVEDADYEGVRVNLIGHLGKANIPLQIDICFSDIVSPAPDMIKYPTILTMPGPELRGYPPESVVAEKLQALVFLGSINSRMKDFYDLWMMAERFEFDAQKLQKAIMNTFDRRNTPFPIETPIGLSETFAAANQTQWHAFLQRIHVESAPETFHDVSRTLRGFLVPLLQACASETEIKGKWKPGGPWELDEEL
jgi:predicted nucleotidyltransferase component of viral defense system